VITDTALYEHDKLIETKF